MRGKASSAAGPRSRRRVPGTILIAVLAGLLLLTVAAVYGVIRARQHQGVAFSRPTGIPATMSTALASLMQLSPVPDHRAPDFTLTDQARRTMSLASLRGRAVVREFMDPHCAGICPIVSQEFIQAYRDLGRRASHVVFVAVNVNHYHLRVADVAAFSREHQLTGIPSWHFLTGTYPRLRAVWRAYGVEVYAPSRNADVVHSSLIYFIDPQGRERYLADPLVDHTKSGSSYLPADQLAGWATGSHW